MNGQGLKQRVLKLAIWIVRSVLAMITIIAAGVITELVAVPIADQFTVIASWVSALITKLTG